MFRSAPRLCGPAAAGSVASSPLLVGMITNSVQGHGAMIAAAPDDQSHWPLCHHAHTPSKPATIASGAWMAAPCL
jgi:hypothetical protein